MENTELLLEWTAAAAGAVYLFLVAKKNKWAWLSGGISSFLYIFVFYQSNLYAQAILSFAYVLLSIFAFWSWNREGDISLISWKPRTHFFFIQFILLLTCFIFWLNRGTFHDFAEKETVVFDVIIALFSLFATILGVLKEKSNWIYWLFINLACITLYLNSQLYATTVLYVAYFLLGIYGLREWNKKPLAP
jgi:nicotinamide mononucleotide transporter